MSTTPKVPWTADLCRTCAHGPACALRSGRRGPVLHCAEYEEGAPSKGNPVAQDCDESDDPLGVDMADGIDRGGLCADCENRANCCFPKPEGGIWHCEEYR